MLLNILHSGGLFYAITAVFLLLEAIFGYQLYKGQKSGSKQQNLGKGTEYFKEPIPIGKNPFLWFCIVVLVLYFFALWQIASDYAGV